MPPKQSGIPQRSRITTRSSRADSALAPDDQMGYPPLVNQPSANTPPVLLSPLREADFTPFSEETRGSPRESRPRSRVGSAHNPIPTVIDLHAFQDPGRPRSQRSRRSGHSLNSQEGIDQVQSAAEVSEMTHQNR
jgi:hypothetical protein